jgi:phage-related protein
MGGDLSEALGRIEQRLKSVEDEIDKLGVKGKAAGTAAGSGMENFGDKVSEAGRKAEKAQRPIGEAGDEALKSGAKAELGAKGFNELGNKFEKAGKKGGDLGSILKVFKWTGLITGAFALAGGISALGAGGAIAIGGLSPMIGVLGGMLPLLLAGKLAMMAWSLAGKQMKADVKDLKAQLGEQIAAGGLRTGVLDLFSAVKSSSGVIGKGMAGIGAEMGTAASSAAVMIRSAPFLAQVSTIFGGLRPILAYLLQGLISLFGVILNVTQAALPMATRMSQAFAQGALWLKNWTGEMLASGKMTQWLNQSWVIFTRAVGVIVDILIGLFNIFRIGGQYAGQMGLSVENAARSFRAWTGSAEGQARINKYFQDSLPALHEMGLLLGMATKGLLGLGAGQNVAPLLAQIRTEFAPALGELVQKLAGQGGLGPALISAATALAQMFANLDFSSLTLFVQGIAGVVNGIVWLMQNVPGASFVVSGLLGTLLGFKLLGPVFSGIGGGLKAFAWMKTAVSDTEKLSAAQKLFGASVGWISNMFGNLQVIIGAYVIPALKSIAIAGVGSLRTLSTALFTTPVGWLILGIMAIIAIIILLWVKCAWFRDAVKAVWTAIQVAAMAVWNAIKVAVSAVIDFFVAAWNWAKNAFTVTVAGIVGAAQLIWQGIKPVVDVLVTIFSVAWSIIKGIVQTAIYIIVGIVTLIAIAVRAVWNGIVAAAQWAWNTILLPIFQMIGSVFTAIWNGIVVVAQAVWNAIAAAVSWFWNTILLPIITMIQMTWSFLWNGMLFVAQAVWGGIVAAAQLVWGFLQPIFAAIGSAGSAIWSVISGAASAVWGAIRSGWDTLWGFLSGLWNTISGAGRSVWDGISAAASAVAGVVKGIWNGIVDAVKGAWNFIARGWNGIPSITVPDWIPVIGGKTFSLPKLPTLWHGGEAPGGAAIVGEHGPEPLVRGNQVVGMVGQNGPELARIPAGGYVVPNLATLAALPGLAKTLPAGVASAVARSVPGYAGAVSVPRGDGGLAREVRALAVAVAERPPPIIANGADIAAEVEAVLRQRDREHELRGKYRY